MKPVRVSVSINAPPERVFALATDLAGAADRITGIDAVEVLTDGPFGVGTRWRETRTMMGREATEVMEVDSCEPGRSFTTVAESHGCRYASGLAVEADGAGSIVTVTLSSQPTSFASLAALTLMSPMSWWMTRLVRKCFDSDLADLRRAAESDDP